MTVTYLEVPFREKDQAKALGARWDARLKKWYVPEGLALAEFKPWLAMPAYSTLSPLSPPSPPGPLELVETPSPTLPVGISATELDVVAPPRAIALSVLLDGVARAVADVFPAGVWTLVEVIEARSKNGHVYLELSERTQEGAVLASARAMIWSSIANVILPAFERATGASLAPGIKLMVRAKPVFKSQYGFSLEIDAIDPEYTLGDLEAKKRDIRLRLQQEGVYGLNKQLPAPWDFNRVLVLAPEGAAGLGDFQSEADALEKAGLCRFFYIHSRFQGEGAAEAMRVAVQQALEIWQEESLHPDALVIIRGGGAVADLAWINDYALAYDLCRLEIPLLTGIGHEKDNTILDEIAHTRFDTPSKVIGGITRHIVQRVEGARQLFQQISNEALRGLMLAREHTEQIAQHLRSQVYHHVTEARWQTDGSLTLLHKECSRHINRARQESRERMGTIQMAATRRVQQAEHLVDQHVRQVVDESRRQIRAGHQDATALLREITGQGSEKTLKRGFAIVRDAKGRPLTTASGISPDQDIQIELQDGIVPARSQSFVSST